MHYYSTQDTDIERKT